MEEECRRKRQTLQRKAVNNDELSEVPPIVDEVLRSPGQPLDPETRAFFEPRFGHDFSHVRVHTDSKAAESARAVNALAYTLGNNVVFDTDNYAPPTTRGRHLIAHELTHVVQQTQSEVYHQDNSSGTENFERAATKVADSVVSGAQAVQPVLRTGRALAKQDDRTPHEFTPGPFLVPLESRAEREVEQPDNGVFFNGRFLIIRRQGQKVFQTTAISGHPDSKESEKNVGPIPDGKYAISPHLTQAPVAHLHQGGTCGAAEIGAGYQELTSNDPSPCKDPPSHYCTVNCPTTDKPNRKCFTPVGCWGARRLRIEGSAVVTTAEGKRVRRDEFYIHGGDHSVNVTSGCIKVFDDTVFDELRKFKSRVSLVVNKMAAKPSAAPTASP